MIDPERPSDQNTGNQITDEDRRRFLELARQLGVGAAVLSVILARPQYAVASGFQPGGGGGPPEWAPGPPPQVPPFK